MFGRVSCFAKHCRQAFDWPHWHFYPEKCTRMGKCRFYMAIGNATFLCLSQTEPRIRFFFYCWYLFGLPRGGIWHQYQSRNGTTRGTRSLVCVVVWLQSLCCSSNVILFSSAAKIRHETKEIAGIHQLWIEQLDTLPVRDVILP